MTLVYSQHYLSGGKITFHRPQTRKNYELLPC